MKYELVNIDMNYGAKQALKKFNYTFSNGVYGLIGPNGAGKTTLMHIMAGIFRPTGGEILIDEKQCNTARSSYAEYIGYLPQEITIYDNLTVYEFLEYIAYLKGISNKKDKISEMLHLVNLADNRNVKCRRLSGGMKRRLGVAQALINDPKILILDEPTTGIDIAERIRLRSLISMLAQDRIILYSTHVASDIEAIAEEVIFLINGGIARSGSISTLLGEISGKVWECDIESAAYNRYTEECGGTKIANVYKNNTGFRIRLLADALPFENAINVSPTLEDFFVYAFSEMSI